VTKTADQRQASAREAATGTVDAREFRSALGHFPTGVVVITACGPDGEPAGMAIGSFTSVSLDPPLLAFLPAKTSATWPRIRAAGSFCANILGAGQEGLVKRFATSGGDKFAGLDWAPGPSGHPVLPGAPAWIDCAIERVDDAGDHWIVLGLVRGLRADVNHPGPLVFCRGALGRFVAAGPGGADDLAGWDGADHRSWWW
jgi:flavin reductase (DIM6/NTAB) family NADH-FMN oxidoreductase RutF